MGFKRFTTRVALRIVFILANAIVIAQIFGDRRLFFNQVILAVVLVVQVWELIRFVNRTNRELARLFYAVRHDDFSVTFKSLGLGSGFADLEASMVNLIQAYKQVKIEREAQFHFLQMLVSQLDIGIVVVEGNENISLMNPAAERLLGFEGARSWRFLSQRAPEFARHVEELGTEGRKLVEIRSPTGTRFIAVNVRTLIILDRPSRLITLQDINSEIEQKEIDAWHKLIRILTHEIMNSVTPISSLTETLQSMLEDRAGNQKKLSDLTEENIHDIRFSLGTIRKRSEGLLRFVYNYRKLTRVPRPTLERVDALEFLNATLLLMAPELEKHAITARVTGDPVSLHIDRALLEQVVINLVANSIHALEGKSNGEIRLSAYRRTPYLIVEVHDNGRGIAQKERPEIFIPFFTTKKNGSGIGLSLSKQILSLHGGSIRVQSEENAGTTFFLQFPCKD